MIDDNYQTITLIGVRTLDKEPDLSHNFGACVDDKQMYKRH